MKKRKPASAPDKTLFYLVILLLILALAYYIGLLLRK